MHGWVNLLDGLRKGSPDREKYASVHLLRSNHPVNTFSKSVLTSCRLSTCLPHICTMSVEFGAIRAQPVPSVQQPHRPTDPDSTLSFQHVDAQLTFYLPQCLVLARRRALAYPSIIEHRKYTCQTLAYLFYPIRVRFCARYSGNTTRFARSN